jgi:oligoribonuclease NrnB/cAMP/cGMP phosphodiesterase (DHH superfamily)
MKTICIYHSRYLDGWMSAAIVKKWFYEVFTKDTESTNVYDFGTKDVYEDVQQHLIMLGWDYGDPIPDLLEYDKVIMCDVSFPRETMDSLWKSHERNFIWIDHHNSAIEINQQMFAGKRHRNYAACELTWKYFFPNKEMPEIVRLLGRYDCFGHKGTDEEQEVLEFQYGARAAMFNHEDCYDFLMMYDKDEIIDTLLNEGGAIYNYLCTEAKQTYKKAFPVELWEPRLINTPLGQMEEGNTVRKFLCVNQDRFNPINFGIDYHKEGYDGFACFWYKDGKWSWLLSNADGEVDCSAIAKQFGGGGHKGAAGFVCDTNLLLKIIVK